MPYETEPPVTPKTDSPKKATASTPPPGRVFASQGELDAAIIGDLAMPGRLHSMLDMANVGPDGTRVYTEQFLTKATEREDPVERLILEQLLILHHRLLRLHDEASKATETEAIKVYNAAAARLSGEFRRLALALWKYRSPAVTKTATFVKMQAVAEHQNVRFVDQSSPGKADEGIVFARRSEVEGKNPSGDPNEPDLNGIREERKTRNCRPDQRLQATTVDG
jgi:hypothetical protein